MKYLFLFITLFSTSLLAQTTGNFDVNKNSIKDLFNQHRVSQPSIIPWAGNFWPYAYKGTANKLDPEGNQSSRGQSPMETYGAISGLGKAPHEWESDNHSCSHLKGEDKESCESWWGHCNGWSGAAIKELEPRKSIKVGSRTLSVADQKGIYTELWLSSGSLNAGLTDKQKKTGAWVNDHSRPTDEYRMFWDVTPKAFFLIFTTYIGAQKTGLVVDRFTGDEVWNQPVVGYRLLPLRKTDISEVRDGNRSYWTVLMRMKFYWANDLGTEPGHISKPFDINKISDKEDVEYLGDDYEGRLLKFRLNFDAEVKINNEGTQILSAGRMLGEGMWDHQENSRDYSPDELNATHPDFIWLPTDPIQDFNGYGNPHMDPSIVAKISQGVEPPAPAQAKVLNLVFAPRVFGGAQASAEEIKKAVTKVIRREGVKYAIYLSDIEISRNKILVPVRFPQGVEPASIEALFKAAEMPVRIQ
ncbi:MAG: hypothetical protein K2P81_07740 [Bacteriovoracaceae bacterium]|nr:hypothetical protein [Bacteriovoracaceae bacterium]